MIDIAGGKYAFADLQTDQTASSIILVRDVADGYEASNQALDLLQQLLIVICMKE